MVMADPSEVGKYGTIRLLKRRELSGVVATYPIDDDEVSFGRDASCSVRLYYTEVSPMHCKIVFEERKAFLQVLGASGAIVDGCPVYPVKSAIPGDPSMTVTVPLPNGSIFEIHKKRFMFNYPPKALRPQLFTPATVRRKNVRMSLVQSAQVFSPAPSPYPRENLRVLQSPVRLPSTESPVRLVDGDHPRVYEEEQDLVILEDVEPRLNGHIQDNDMRLQTLPPARQVPPQTPRRRAAPSLHRAVLIRSAQRTAYTQSQLQRHQLDPGPQFEEIDLDDEDAEGEEEEGSDDEQDEEDEVINSILNTSEDAEEDLPGKQEEMEEMILDAVQDTEEVSQVDEQDITEAQEEYQRELNNEHRFTTPLQVSRALHLGAFMTPQPGLFAKISEENQHDRRKTGPQRPPPGFNFPLAPGLGTNKTVVKEEEMDQDGIGNTGMPTSPSKRRGISEEERKAILERRKSVRHMPDPDVGVSDSKLGDHGKSTIPPPIPPPASPFKTLSTHIEEGEDTQVVLKRMQVQVAERRASLSPTRPRISRDVGNGMLPPSPQKMFSLLASGTRLRSPIREMPDFEDGLMEEKQNQPPMQDSMDVDDVAGAEKDKEQRTVEENDENMRPTHPPSRTPSFGGVRELFRAPKSVGGLVTPAVRGVRDLFRAPTTTLQTPRMEGVRELFAEKRAQETPDFEGIGDMMHVDEPNQVDDSSRSDRVENADVPEDVGENPEPAVRRAAPTRKLPLATRTLTRTRGGSRPTLIRTRGTPTDVSTMADDEATPDSEALDPPKRLIPEKGIPEAAVVHRKGRVRRQATTVTASDVEDSEVPTALDSGSNDTSKPTPRRGRAAKAKVQDETENEEEPPAKPPSKSRGRRKADPVASSAGSDVVENVTTHSTRRGARTSSAQLEEATSTPTPGRRRSTRARSRSTEPESDDDAKKSTRAVVQAKVATTVETIPEEEEPVSTHARPARKRATGVTTRTRRTRTRTDSSTEDAPPKKRAGTSSPSAGTRRGAKASAVEPTAGSSTQVENKENTPERSPVSESGDDSSAAHTDSHPKGRAATAIKVAPASKMKQPTAGRAKSTSRSAKAKTEDEDSAPAPRATRARARK